MKENSNKVSYIVLSVIICFLLLIILFLKKGDINEKDKGTLLPDGSVVITDKDYDWKHLWIDINDILNEENYNKVWINPEKYETFWDFIEDFAGFDDMKVDPVNEKFVISIKWEDGMITYVPFDFKKNRPATIDDWVSKNLAILDIYNAYKEWNLYWWADSNTETKLYFEDDFFHPASEELAKIFTLDSNLYDYIDQLESITELSDERTDLLLYLYDLKWDYDKAEELRKKQCETLWNCDDKYINLTVAWKALDSDWNPVSGAKIELLNNSQFTTITWEDGSYSYSFLANKFTHLRFKATMEWYSDWFETAMINKFEYPRDDYIINVWFVMHRPDERVTITHENYELFIVWWNYYLIEMEWSKYFVPIDGLYYEDETPYLGHNFEAHLFQFTKWTNMESLLENDTFSPIYWYVWNIMKTFGMPLIQFFDLDSWKELFIKSSNPMILQNQVYHMKELYEDYDEIYWPITKEDMEYLYEYSEAHEWYPIDFDFLTENNFLRWPVRWSLDRKKWTWESVGQRLLDMDWLVELPFYSINDTD